MSYGQYQFRAKLKPYCLNPLLLRQATPRFILGQPGTYAAGRGAGSRLPGPRFLVTGTREAVVGNAADHALVRKLLGPLPADAVLIQGGAPGIDEIAAREAHSMGLYVHTVLPAPGAWDSQFRADRVREIMAVSNSWERLATGTPIERDELAIGRAEWVFGIPYVGQWEAVSRRSGTWATLRRAWDLGKCDDDSITLLYDWRREYAALHRAV